jgi:hypothetical protein
MDLPNLDTSRQNRITPAELPDRAGFAGGGGEKSESGTVLPHEDDGMRRNPPHRVEKMDEVLPREGHGGDRDDILPLEGSVLEKAKQKGWKPWPAIYVYRLGPAFTKMMEPGSSIYIAEVDMPGVAMK